MKLKAIVASATAAMALAGVLAFSSMAAGTEAKPGKLETLADREAQAFESAGVWYLSSPEKNAQTPDGPVRWRIWRVDSPYPAQGD